MAQCRSIVLPAVAWMRGYHLLALHADGAIVYRRADGTVIESRDTWPDGTTGLSPVPVPVPGTWTRLTPE